jgi:CheY-like chemotaxis protein
MNKILLVENDPSAFDLYEEIIKELGLEVIKTPNNKRITSYESAIAAIKVNKFIPLAILDIYLDSEKTGFDIAEYIIKLNLDTRIRFTTLKFDEETLERQKAIGGDVEFIDKSVSGVNKEVAKYKIQASLLPTNPKLLNQSKDLWINCRAINLKKAILEVAKNNSLKSKSEKLDVVKIDEILYQDKQKSVPHCIVKNEILCIVVGTYVDLKSDCTIIIPNNLSIIITNSEHDYISTSSLTKVLKELKYDNFIQVNRNTIVNINNVSARDSRNISDFNIIIKNCGSIKVSDELKTNFIQRMQAHGKWID